MLIPRDKISTFWFNFGCLSFLMTLNSTVLGNGLATNDVILESMDTFCATMG